jgi:hypothetical protein
VTLAAVLACLGVVGTVEHQAESHTLKSSPYSTRLVHAVDHSRNAAQNCRRRLEGHGWPVEFLERRTSSLPLRRWVLRRWNRRAAWICGKLERVIAERASQSPATAICDAFGAECAKAIRVAQCESGLNPRAVGGGGLYYGMFQFGAYARSTYGFAWDARTQAFAAAAMRRAEGWGPWPVCGLR